MHPGITKVSSHYFGQCGSWLPLLSADGTLDQQTCRERRALNAHQPQPDDPSTALGEASSRAADDRGLTHADAAHVLGSAESKVGRIENAQSGIRLPDLRALMDAYGVTDPGARQEIEILARESKQKAGGPATPIRSTRPMPHTWRSNGTRPTLTSRPTLCRLCRRRNTRGRLFCSKPRTQPRSCGRPDRCEARAPQGPHPGEPAPTVGNHLRERAVPPCRRKGGHERAAGEPGRRQ
ncbi:helix-turn-helix domain-containing protein [Streptacidiphilus sp. PB12-B1b]|nr:helix-turn-helix domain-containing protein [Streptacidiphilus sp. PB12-B1b]